MIIENKRFDVLSRGENNPEEHPVVSESFVLLVQAIGTLMALPENATITPEFIDTINQYTAVKGKGSVGGETYPCIATYEVGMKYPEGTKIGNLTLKNFINEV